MAICKECGRDMRTADGCGVAFLTVNGKRYERVKYGAPADLFPRQYGRCGDCGARRGHYHHFGCDCEACPVCGHQLISCECDVE